MGIVAATLVARHLIDNGLNAATPTAVIEDGTRLGQEIVTGQIANLELILRDNALTASVVIIIGAVADLASASTEV
jgi:siroheme synthase